MTTRGAAEARRNGTAPLLALDAATRSARRTIAKLPGIAAPPHSAVARAHAPVGAEQAHGDDAGRVAEVVEEDHAPALLAAGHRLGRLELADVGVRQLDAVSYTHLRAHETPEHLV